MRLKQVIVSVLSALPTSLAAETVVGVYMFHRHGDRTPKVFPPANLTDLGYHEVHQSGAYYRNRYITDEAASKIFGISSQLVNEVQIAASAPVDPVLQNSAQGFLQGLYPPVGSDLGSISLATGRTVEAPLGGYQLIPVNTVESGGGSENSGWLQDATACSNAEISSNNYFYSMPYQKLYTSTRSFYEKLMPVISPTFNHSTATFQNAYTIYDLINVAKIHNSTTIVPDATFTQLHALANVHEYNLAYNSSSTIRAIAGKQLAAEIVDFLATTIETGGETSKFGIQFGSYGTFFSFFGLAQLPAADPTFYGIVNYASAMSFELFTDKPFTGFPATKDLMVRFFFHNGTTSTSSTPMQYPLFGQKKMDLSWMEFKEQMSKFSVGTSREWCHVCGNTTGTCLQYSLNQVQPGRAGTPSIAAGSSGSGLSNVECGVIGAFVTLGVIIIIEGAILLFSGLTLVKKNRLVAGKAVANGVQNGGKA